MKGEKEKKSWRSTRRNIRSPSKDFHKSSPKEQKTDISLTKQSIKTDLKIFYDQEAKKYHQTRKKYWKEGETLVNYIQQHFQGREIRILEFGCGSGRFASYLSEHYTGNFKYQGVDLSKELIKYAQQDNPNLEFIAEDISKFLPLLKQESFDLIIGTSSFQHIPSYKERLFLMKHFYRTLKYEGLVVMTNRALSEWFAKKHRKPLLNAIGKYLLTLGKADWRNILVPRTNKGKTSTRYYHLFSLKELKKLTDFSGFSLKECSYLDKDGSFTPKSREARNSLLIAEKFPLQN